MIRPKAYMANQALGGISVALADTHKIQLPNSS